MLLFSQNQTANWLKSKDGQEKKKLIKACIRVGRDQHKIYKQRKNDIQLHREKVIQEKKEALVKKMRGKKLTLCTRISHQGFWMSEEDAILNLSRLPTESKKKAALKDQLKFRELVLCQGYVDKSVFQFSKAKKQFTSQQLLGNLCKLIHAAQETPTIDNILTNPKLLIGTHIQHRGRGWVSYLV